MIEGYIPPIVWRVCARKQPYKTKKEARLAAFLMRRKTDARISSYRCIFCEQYHVGKATRWHD